MLRVEVNTVSMRNNNVSEGKGRHKGKINVYPRTGHEGPERE